MNPFCPNDGKHGLLKRGKVNWVCPQCGFKTRVGNVIMPQSEADLALIFLRRLFGL